MQRGKGCPFVTAIESERIIGTLLTVFLRKTIMRYVKARHGLEPSRPSARARA